MLKIISWNVNGIRAALKKDFAGFIKKHKPDILCLQETKAPNDGSFELKLDGYIEYWSHAKKKGYSGTAILSKIKPKEVKEGIGASQHDEEGRVLTAEYDDFYLVNVYVPNTKRDLSRLSYREKEWDVDFLKYLKKLEQKKPVIFCGDLNVAHQEIDLTYPKANVNNHGFTPQERKGFDNIVKAGFIDTFREFEKDGGHYTWWSQMSNCRAKNIGWRIDYSCISSSLRPRLKTGFILKEVMGSDHCPVGITLK
ncbi:MAG: exodeoxyribonuclease III [Omnitrophica WOR_2 bacterium GWA2_47_8]|nr:MAG: exodeoxyribonuclease III [Omnitrophica WOR_2 bacterium GWA2_47_8]